MSLSGSAAAKPTKRSGNRRTSSAISSLAMRANSAATSGGPTSSSGGTASTSTWAYSPYGSIFRHRASRSVSTRIEGEDALAVVGELARSHGLLKPPLQPFEIRARQDVRERIDLPHG